MQTNFLKQKIRELETIIQEQKVQIAEMANRSVSSGRNKTEA
jgi:hypothetical protein